MAGALVFGTIGVAFGKASSTLRPHLVTLYLLLYVGAILAWFPKHDFHVAYMAVPVMLCLAFGVLMWPKIDGLHYPILAVAIPTFTMLWFLSYPTKDVVIYGFYFLAVTLFAITIRRTRLRTAFALFVFRENLREKVDRDPLTGLLNRAGWREQASNICKVARQSGLPATVLFFDIDHFKKVNDEHGHATGDKVLVHVANILKNGLREGDVLARLGGEEFVAALLGVASDQGKEMANQLRKDVQDSKSPVPVTVSAGVAEVTNDVNLIQAMHQADMGLLEAKSLGRNQVCMLPPSSIRQEVSPFRYEV